MTYWEFIGMANWPAIWGLVSAILAALTIMGVVIFIFSVCTELRWYWNVILIPALLVATFFIVTWLAWSGTGGGA